MTAPDPSRKTGDRPMAAILVMCCAVASFAIQDAISKHLSAGYPAVEVAWFRYTFGVVAIAAVLPWLEPRTALVSRRPLHQVVRGVLLYASTVLFVVAIYWMPLATATAIGFVSPLFLTALSIPFLGERVGPRRWAAIGVGFLGVLIVVRPGFGEFQWSFLIPIVMAPLYATYQVLTRIIGGVDRPITSLLYPTVIGATLGALPMPFVWVTPQPFDFFLMVMMGIGGTLSHLCLIYAFSMAKATTLAPFAYTQLLWVTALGYVFFGDIPDGPTLAGAAVIVGSGLYVLHRERRLKGL